MLSMGIRVPKEEWITRTKVHGEGFTLEKTILFSCVSEQTKTGNEIRDALS